MTQIAVAVLNRLRATWFGSVLAVVWLGGLLFAPLARHCFGVAAVVGGQSGIICDSTPPLENPSGAGLFLLLLFVAVIVTAPLVFPHRSVMLLVGFGSAAIVVALILFSIDVARYLVLSRLGLDVTSDAQSALLLLLPVSALWIVAGVRRRTV
jgi:hypothetical protein